MRFLKPVSHHIVIAYGIMLGMVAVLGGVPWSFVSATASAADQAEPKETTVNGKFASFKDGVLKVKVQDSQSDVWKEREWKVSENTNVVSNIRGVEREGTAREAFKPWEPGAVIAVEVKDGKVTFVEIGSKQAAEKAPDKAPNAPDKAADKVAQKAKTVRGWFESFEDGTLSIGYSVGLVKNKTLIQIPENAKTFMWNHDEGRSKPVDTAEAMRQLKVLAAPVSTLDTSPVDTAETMIWRKAGTGLVVQIADDNVTIRIGENKAPYVGNFVSFKDDLLLFRLKNPSLQFQKSYGDTVKFKMNEDIPVYESIDGSEYKHVGTPRTVLGNVKEGTIITVYHNYKTETDEFYLVLIGVKKK